MLDGTLPDLLITMAQTAKAVDILLEEIGINSPDAQTQLMSIVLDGLPIVFQISGNVNGDTGAGAGDFVDFSRICQLLAWGTCRS